MKTKLNENMIQLLSSLVGKKFISFECDLEEKWNRAYCYLRINTDSSVVDISNEQELVNLFGENEDVSCLKCFANKGKSLKETFSLIDSYKSKEIFVNELIESISIISEKVKVDENNTMKEIEFDMAIIIKTANHEYMFSRENWFDEFIYINIDKKFNDIYPISKDKEIMSNDKSRNVFIKRNTINI